MSDSEAWQLVEDAAARAAGKSQMLVAVEGLRDHVQGLLRLKGGPGSGNFGHGGRPGKVGGSGSGGAVDLTADVVSFKKGKSNKGKTLNGVPFKKAKAQKWETIPDKQINEPPVPELGVIYHDKQGNPVKMRQAAGVVCIEPDGRMWVVEPLNHYAGYQHTFPKGGQEEGLTLQQTALKEAWEESGLQMEITGYLTDARSKESSTRYYIGKRIGGDPAYAGEETHKVKLATPSNLREMLNRSRDRKVLQKAILAQITQQLSEVRSAYLARKATDTTSPCGAGETGHPGFLPGNTCAGTGGSSDAGVKDDKGKYIPGKVGDLSGVDTSKWPAHNTTAQWAMKKIHLLEQAAMDGDWDTVASLQYAPGKTTGLNPYQKGILKAQEEINKAKADQIGEYIKEATQSEEIPAAVTTAGWTKIGEKLGTQPGGTYIGPDGKKYYVKIPTNPDFARNEVLAAKLYELAGAPVVKAHLLEIDGKTAIATEWIETTGKLAWNDAQKIQASQDFAAHAWLNNRDAVGAGSENPMDNMRMDMADYKIKMLDAGGSLDYSGSGNKKDFGIEASEWDTMRDPAKNPTMAQVFGGMTPEQLIASGKKIEKINYGQIKKIVDEYHGGTDVEKKLMADILHERVVAIANKVDTMEKSIVAAKPIPKTAAKIPAAIPTPPVMPSHHAHLDKKFNAIFAAAATGNLDAVKAVSANPASQNTYTKQLVKYKNTVLAAMGAGGDITPLAPPKPKAPKEAATKPTITIDATKFPADPHFASSNAANVAMNNAAVAKMKEHAVKGDLSALQTMTVPPSPKLQEYHKSLISNVSHQLNPPPPPTPLKGDYAKLSAGIKPAKEQPGKLKAVGYWSILGDVGGIPKGIPKGEWINGSPQVKELWAKGRDAAHSSGALGEIKMYMGSSYEEMNEPFRTGNHNNHYFESSMKAAKAIMDHGVEIPSGVMLSRKHNGINAMDLKPGQVVSDKGILSTSVDKNVWSGSTHWRMVAGEGVKGMPVGELKKGHEHSEQEVILPPNQRIMVTHIEKHPTLTDTYIVHAVILPTLDSQCCPP